MHVERLTDRIIYSEGKIVRVPEKDLHGWMKTQTAKTPSKGPTAR